MSEKNTDDLDAVRLEAPLARALERRQVADRDRLSEGKLGHDVDQPPGWPKLVAC